MLKTVNTHVGSTTTLVGQIRDTDGDLLTAGTVVCKLRQDFGEFGETTLAGVGEVLAVPVVSDAFWSPGVDGSDGYNFKAIIASSSLTAIGTYRVEFAITESAKTYKLIFKVRVASG